MTRGDKVLMLHTINMALSRQEKEVFNEAIDALENPADVTMAKRILTMIEKSGANVDEIKQFCSNYIQSKEEEE